MVMRRDNFSGIIEVTAPSGGYTEGVPADLQDLRIVPRGDIAAAAVGEADIGNGWTKWTDAPKTGGTALDWIQFETVYWDISAVEFTTVASGNTAAGVAAATAVIGATVGDVLLFPAVA